MSRLGGSALLRLCVAAMLAVVLFALPFQASGQSTGSIVIAQTTDAATLDPAFRVDTTTGNNILHVYDPLMMRGPDMEVVPWLAESVEKISDYVWEVRLREGVFFTNGEPLNATAVRFSLERILDPAMQSPMKRWFVTIASIDDVVIVDDYTLHFTTSSLDPLFQVRMTFLFPVPPLYVQRVGDSYFGLHPIGTGPYELVEWVRDDHIELRAKSDYWAGVPPIQNVTFRVVPEELSRVAALLNGEADLIVAISPYQAEFLRGVSGMRIESAPGTRVITVDFDIDVAPADQLKFRQLVSYAIDRDQIINGLLRGFAQPVNSSLSPGTPGWPKNNDYTYPYDPAKARELAGELGLAGQEILMRADTGSPDNQDIVLAIAAQLADVGITIKLNMEEWGSWFADLKNHDQSALYLNSQGNVWIDPYPQLDAFYHSQGFISCYRNPDVDALLAASNEVLGEDRAEIFGQILEILEEEAAGVPLFARVFTYGVSDRIQWSPRSDDVVRVMEMSLRD